MSILQGSTTRRFDLFGQFLTDPSQGILNESVQFKIDPSQILKGEFGIGVVSLINKASSIEVLASNDTIFSSYE